MAKQSKNIECHFVSKHASLTLPYGKKTIEFRNYRYKTTDPEEIKLLKGACKRKNPVTKIELVEEIDLDKQTERTDENGGEKDTAGDPPGGQKESAGAQK